MSKKNLANKYDKLFALRIYNISYSLVSVDLLSTTEEGGGMEG